MIPQGLFQPRCKLESLKNRRVPEDQVGFMSPEGEKKAVKIMHLCFCEVEDNEESLNLSFKGNQNQALKADLSNSRYSSTESKHRKIIFIG